MLPMWYICGFLMNHMVLSCPDLHSFYLDSVEKVDNHSVQIKYRANMDLSEAIMKIVGYFGLQYIYNRMR